MTKNYLDDENWNDEEILLREVYQKISKSLQCPEDDFIPKDYQSEFAHLTKTSNKIIFIPHFKDKLYTSLSILKSSSADIKKNGKQIFYLVDSPQSISEITDFLTKHLYYNIVTINQELSEDSWRSSTKNAQIIVASSVSYLNALSRWYTKPTEAYLIFFDDCAYGSGGHSMKQIMNFINNYEEHEWPKIVAYTSCLLNPQIKVEYVFEFLKNLEITFNSTIVTSQYCGVVKKLLPGATVKFVKFRSFKGNLEDYVYRALYFENLIGKTIAAIDRLRFSDNLSTNDSLKKKSLEIFHDIISSIYLYGTYPAFIVTGIYRVKLEKMKLLSCDSSNFVLSAIISDLYVLKSLIYEKITNNGSKHPNSAATIIKNCSEKIVKLLSLLYKLDYDGTCTIFVDNCITARMIAFLLQELSKCEPKISHIVADFIISGDSIYESDYDREKFLYSKQLKATLKKFQQRSLNTLVITWDTDVEIGELKSDWIIYFDMPPSYKKYILSRRFANDTKNRNFFFLEETGDTEKFKKYKNALEEFFDLDEALKQLSLKKDINDEERFRRSFNKLKESKNELEEKFPPLITKHNKRVDFSISINIVNKYCKSLPCDGFSSPALRWSFYKKDGGIVCKLQLPMQSGIRTQIECSPIKNVKFLKQITALETVKFLYKQGHLNEDLLSTYCNVNDEFNSKNLFPNWKEEDESIKPGSSKCFRTIPLKFPVWFNHCAPQPETDSYLHIIYLKPVYDEPTDSRKLFFHKLMQSSQEFGILTSKKLPQICKFPVYTDLGQVDVNFQVNAKILRLSEEQIDKLQRCHKFIFLDVLQTVKGFLVGDFSNGDNSYCIAPLTPSDEGTMTIAWDVVNNLSVKCDVTEPSEDERIYTNYSANDYLGKVVSPWYRMHSEKYYIVTRVCTECTPNTPFPSGEFETFTEYYDAKYSLEVKQPIQPLLEARIITDNLKCIRPRAQNPGVKKKKGEKEQDHKVILLPEFCIRQPFPAVYWYKSILLLAVTHRLHYILLAEELRNKIASEAQQNGVKSWPDDEEDIMIADESYVKECEEPAKQVVPLLSILKKVQSLKNLRRYPWGDEQLPIDIERHLDGVSILDVMSYCDFITAQPAEESDPLFGIFYPKAFEFPRLKFLDVHHELSPGPKLGDLIQALTGVNCDDIVNLERFKMVGKSFLNFSVTFWLYKLYPNFNILQLRRLKQKIMSKRNLYYCGATLELGSYIKLHDFSENNDWFMSGFCVPNLFMNILENSFIPPEVIFNVEIPREEQYTGQITPETRNKIQDKMIDYYNKTSKGNESSLHGAPISDNCDHNHAIIYFKKHSVPDKDIVNALKSLIGIYLTNTGVESTFKLLQYVGILKDDISAENFHKSDLESTEEYSHCGHESLKDILGYEFNDKKLLLEALTHHSYFNDSAIDCNYKLAFLGESVLDLLITTYTHEHFKNMKISEVQELRVSLMNDVVFAIISARLGLHKFLLLDSIKLVEKINQFIDEEKMLDFKINGEELLFLIEETNSVVTDSVDVPRALTDVFKAIIAAVFLDCKGNLKTVWKVVHGLMKNEIDKFGQLIFRDQEDKFTNVILRDPVKLLGETALKFIFGNPVRYGKSSNLVIVPLHIEMENSKKVFFGVGSSKNQAKRIAAKIALKELAKELVL